MNRNHPVFDHGGSLLALAVFRLHGAMIAAGDALAAPFGLTSARWQVLGALSMEAAGLSAAQVGRNMGLSRQAVQRVLDDLERAGLVAYGANPDHKRAKLARLTDLGQAKFNAVSDAWIPRADALTAGIGPAEFTRLLDLLHLAQQRLTDEKP